ncbi:Zinc Finger Mym-Type Protein 4 [Manis pentadactyla]|nr:Zinc Finger Mym-Type Protein 4 [Manis pentadactyla]
MPKSSASLKLLLWARSLLSPALHSGFSPRVATLLVARRLPETPGGASHIPTFLQQEEEAYKKNNQTQASDPTGYQGCRSWDHLPSHCSRFPFSVLALQESPWV